jgi:uncharacterized protein YqgC (DUF456 family)
MSSALSTSVSVVDVRRGSIRVGFTVLPTPEFPDVAAVVAVLDTQITTQGSKLMQGTVTSDIDTSFTAIAFVANIQDGTRYTDGGSASPIGAIIGGVFGHCRVGTFGVRLSSPNEEEDDGVNQVQDE